MKTNNTRPTKASVTITTNGYLTGLWEFSRSSDDADFDFACGACSCRELSGVAATGYSFSAAELVRIRGSIQLYAMSTMRFARVMVVPTINKMA